MKVENSSRLPATQMEAREPICGTGLDKCPSSPKDSVSTIGTAKYSEISKKQVADSKKKLEDVQSSIKAAKKEPKKTCGQKIKQALASFVSFLKRLLCCCCGKKPKAVDYTANLRAKLEGASEKAFIAEANALLDAHGDKFSIDDRIYLRALLNNENSNGAAKSETQIKADFKSFIHNFEKGLNPAKKEEQAPTQEIEMTSVSTKGDTQEETSVETTSSEQPNAPSVSVKMEVPSKKQYSQGPDIYPSASNTLSNLIRNEDL